MPTQVLNYACHKGSIPEIFISYLKIVKKAHGPGPSRLVHRSQELCCEAPVATISLRGGVKESSRRPIQNRRICRTGLLLQGEQIVRAICIQINGCSSSVKYSMVNNPGAKLKNHKYSAAHLKALKISCSVRRLGGAMCIV